uniref:Uncharacterized protein n=1 Tax=Macrostomum lignano TaxID=282301 RepID=A0A1I8FHS8_9PLAT
MLIMWPAGVSTRSLGWAGPGARMDEADHTGGHISVDLPRLRPGLLGRMRVADAPLRTTADYWRELGAPPGRPPLARPFWVPRRTSSRGCWSEQPPVLLDKVDIHSMQELDNGAGKLISQPLADYTPGTDAVLRGQTCSEHTSTCSGVWCKRLYNDRQVSTIKEIIQAEKLPLEDFSAHFSQTSPVVPTLRSATLADDILTGN